MIRSTLLVAALAIACDIAPSLHPAHAAEQRQDLQLDVVINGAPIGMIGSFTLFPGRVIGATGAELESLGLRAGNGPAAAGMVMLSDIPTLRYAYDERAQRISITVDNAYRLATTIDLSHGAGTTPVHATTGWGMVMNYDLFNSVGSQPGGPLLAFTGTSLTLDARAFSPDGTIAQSEIITAGPDHAVQAVRLESSYRYSDPAALVSWTAGDLVSGGLAWTRPIRIGGAQGDSNFALRPDLVTMPLPNLGATATVPSTVDVYVNSIKAFSQSVGTGPFTLSNIPIVTGAGNAVVVVRDSSGQATTTNIPFYGSAQLLTPGLRSWSVEAGLPRLAYGSTDDRYENQPVGSATVRQGVLDWFTAEGHAEGGSGVANGGLGGVARIGALGIASAALAGSSLGRARGAQAAFTVEAVLFGINVDISSQHTAGTYNDLASATARQRPLSLTPGVYALGSPGTPLPSTPLGQPFYADARAPTALDRITLGGPMPFDPRASWGLSLVHERSADGTASRLASLSYTRQMPWAASLFGTAYKDFVARRSAGVLFGLSIPIGQTISASATASGAPEGAGVTLQASQALDPAPGSAGWQVQDTEGAAPYREADAAYRSRFATVQASADLTRAGGGGTFNVTGAVATMGGDVFFSDRIDDAFAVVDAGAPGVAVAAENQPIGTTDSQGLMLVPTLRSYQKNRLSIDPSSLPADAEIGATERIVTPADRAGTMVSFNVHHDSTAALVIFSRPDGSAIPAGAAGRLQGGSEFVVGYDGQAFIKGLAVTNHVDIDLGGVTCHASFGFTPRRGAQVRIGPVACH